MNTLQTAPPPSVRRPAPPPPPREPQPTAAPRFAVVAGRVPGPQRTVLYGPGGIGKSTLAARAPGVVFLDVENGTRELDVPRVEGIETFADLRACLQSGALDAFKTIVLDSVTKAEELAIAHTLATVTAYAPGTVTAPGNDAQVGDVILLRRAGVGLWSLATVQGIPVPGSLTILPVAGTTLHAIAAGDELHLVEAYWLGMVWRDFEPRGDAGWYAKEVAYAFRGSGASSYARTVAAVGS